MEESSVGLQISSKARGLHQHHWLIFESVFVIDAKVLHEHQSNVYSVGIISRLSLNIMKA